MRIIKLVGSNIKKIKCIDISPNKYVNRITGANGSGKTSVLDMIEWGLVGGKNIPSQPVRRGAVNGKIKIDVGDTSAEVELTRQFFEGSSKRAGRLSINQLPGADASEFQDKRKKINSPDELEDALLRQVSFDPLEFLRMEPKKQYHVLRRISTPDIDMDALDEQIQKDFDLRTEAGRKRNQLEAALNELVVPDNLPTEPKDVSSMVAELAQASDYNLEIERETRRRQRISEESARAQEDIFRLKRELEEAEIHAGRLQVEIEKWEPLAKPKDAAALAEQIEEARTINRAIERGQLRARKHTEFMEADEEWSRLDASVKEGERRKKEAIAHAHYPVEGLGFGNQEVMFNGLPFDQASNAEQIRVSVAIGMTTNSKVRIMRIKDGSLLDNNSLETIAEMAHEKDFQVWIEAVSESGEIGIYLEDGEVKAVNDEPLDAPPLAPPTPKKKTSKKKVSK